MERMEAVDPLGLEVKSKDLLASKTWALKTFQSTQKNNKLALMLTLLAKRKKKLKLKLLKLHLNPKWLVVKLASVLLGLEVKWKDLLVKRIWELGLLLYTLKNSKLA
jgi:hypothetical protein